MSGIVVSSAVSANLQALKQITEQLAVTQKRLATGKRVNSAIDNPTNFFTAAALNARAGNLNVLLDSMGNAQKALDAASNGLQTIQKLVESAQSLANQALQTAGSNAKVTGTNSTALTTASTIATSAGSATALKAGDTITVGDGTTTVTYTAANGDTVQTFLNAVNNNASLKVRGSLTSDGKIKLEALSTNSIVIGGSVSAPATLANVVGLTAGTTTGTLNATRQSLAQQYDAIRTQIDQAASDASFNGVNLLAGGGLSVVFNENGTSQLSVSGVSYTAASLGIGAVSSGSANQFQSDTEINSALTALSTALNTIRAQASSFGASLSVVQARQDFAKSMINTLKSGADNLVLADTNEESALMLALQTRQQLATTSLSLAAQADQNVLRLF